LTSSGLAERLDAPPRVLSHPDYAFSHAEDVADLAEIAGLYLDPWQQMVLQHALGERADGKWAAFETAVLVSRQNGKGSILEARELAGLFLLDEALILHSAHEYRTSMEAHRRLVACLARLGRRINDNLYEVDGVPVKVINTNGEEGLERLDTGQRVKFIARSKNAGRGFTADCLIWDEAYALDEQQVDAQMPTLSARPNGQIWYTSSPPLDAVSGAQLFRVRRRALAGDRDGLAYFDWGAAGCLDDLSGVDLDDRRLWAACNPAYGYRIAEEAIERERAAMSDQGFARERLGIWPPDLSEGFQVIGEGDWCQAYDQQSQITGALVFAPAVSLDRARTSIGVAGARRDGMRHLEVVENRPGTGWVVQRLRELVARHRPAAVVVDEFGPTGSLIAPLEEAGIAVERIGTGDVARAFGMFYDGVCGDEAARVLRHIGQAELTAAVAGAITRSLGEGKAWDRKNAAVDITPLVAVTNAHWGYAHFGHQRPSVPMVAWR